MDASRRDSSSRETGMSSLECDQLMLPTKKAILRLRFEPHPPAGETIEGRIINALNVSSPQSTREAAAAVGLTTEEEFISLIVRLSSEGKMKATSGGES